MAKATFKPLFWESVSQYHRLPDLLLEHSEQIVEVDKIDGGRLNCEEILSSGGMLQKHSQAQSVLPEHAF